MLNKIIILFTDLVGYFLMSVRLDNKMRPKNDIRCVFYHGIGDKESAAMRYLNDEIPLHVFKKHIDYIQSKYVLLSLKEAVDLAVSGKLPRGKPVCTISFDDGLRSVYSDAYPVLKEKGIPFDVFLNTAVVGNNNLLWLHSLNYLLAKFGIDSVAEVINRSIDKDYPKVPSNALAIERWYRNNFDYCFEISLVDRLFENYNLRIREVADKQKLYLTWEQIVEMSGNGVGFYSHTHRHFPLNSLSRSDVIKSEIAAAYDIMKINGKNNTFVSFPFGMEVDYGKRAISSALSVGHEYIVEVGEGLNSQKRIQEDKIISRVGLGNIESKNAKLYAAIEVRPVVKNRMKRVLKKIAQFRISHNR